jgi:hypothetical protein
VTDYDPATAELLYGAVADDEGLRDDLDDAAYGPLLSWAAERADSLATIAEADVDTLAEHLREAVRLLVEVVAGADPAELASVPPDIIPPEHAGRVAEAIVAASDDPVERANVIALVLSEAGE